MAAPEVSDSSIKSTTNETLSASSTADTTSFKDYEPPPSIKILPPAKYKLWILVFILVYFASWVASEAKLIEFLRFDGWLSPEASLFLMLGVIVFVLVYGTMDLAITLLTFKVKDKEYGIGSWLKQPRAQWMYHHENIVFEICAGIIVMLEEGFAMFDAPPLIQDRPLQFFECADGVCTTTLKIEHRVKPDKLEAYDRWVVRIKSAVQQANGFLEISKSEIETEWDEEEGGVSSSVSSKDPAHAQLHMIRVYVKFASIDFLNEWMASPRRRAIMRALEPLLIQPDIVQIQGNRRLPDAFSDLLTRQGQGVRKAPPKKWKVWWLTLLALFITIRWSNSFLPYYFQKWGLHEADERLERMVTSLVSTFLNSYVMTPLFLFVFNHWLQVKDAQKVKNTRQPWKTFDEGFASIWLKIFITFAFYGGCLIASLVDR